MANGTLSYRVFARVGVAVFVAFSCVSAAFAEGEGERRELGSHEHGHGQLDIAVEGNHVAIELEIPAFDIVGFEHEAVSEEEKAGVLKAQAVLVKPLVLFGPSRGAGCKTISADVVFGNGAPDKHDEHEHKDHDEHDATHSDERESKHSEVRASYKLSCATPEKLTQFSLTFFNAFPRVRELDVNAVTPSGQFKREVSKAHQEVLLRGGK